MDNYLGEFHVDIKTTEFKDYGPKEWALHYIFMYAQIDGGHHKMWVLDQVARILHGMPITVVEARWKDGQKEYRFKRGEPTQEYLGWVEKYKHDESGNEYEWDEGCAP